MDGQTELVLTRTWHHAPATSHEAGAKAALGAEAVRASLLALYRDGDYTADEAATRLGLDVLSVRPRVTDLAREGELVATGRTRPNVKGNACRVLRLARHRRNAA